jgi:ketosteroid isomerase-like protein
MPPDMPTVVGRSAWRELWESLDISITELTATTAEIDGLGTLAYLRGAYTETFTIGDAPEPISVTGKHLAILRRQPDGSWLITRWIWNSDEPDVEQVVEETG